MLCSSKVIADTPIRTSRDVLHRACKTGWPVQKGVVSRQNQGLGINNCIHAEDRGGRHVAVKGMGPFLVLGSDLQAILRSQPADFIGYFGARGRRCVTGAGPNYLR